MTTATVLQEAATEEREKRLISLYKKAFPAVAKYVHKMGGDLEEARDVFHDAVLVYYESRSDKEIKNKTGYLLGIVKHLWTHKFRAGSRMQRLESWTDRDDEKTRTPSTRQLMRILETAGRKCMELLRAFYYDKLSPADLAARFGYAGKRSVTVQKFKCLEKVRNKVEEKSLSYEDFLE